MHCLAFAAGSRGVTSSGHNSGFKPPRLSMTASTNNSWNASSTYDAYIGAGTYTRRYPRCNPRMLDFVLNYGRRSHTILDFGTGTGRYALPLLHHTRASIVAYDISSVALENLRRTSASFSGSARFAIAGPDFDECAAHAPYDLILCLFGVVAHIPGRQHRVHLLRRLRSMLRPSPTSTLVLSVPNATRRFCRLQRLFRIRRERGQHVGLAEEDCDIFYERFVDGDPQSFFYHLYSASSLKQELRDSGFVVKRLFPESVLPETVITRYRSARLADTLLCKLVPLRWAYGIAASATI
jgi:tRNA (uracil-5-)-methyltransferase TRM9